METAYRYMLASFVTAIVALFIVSLYVFMTFGHLYDAYAQYNDKVEPLTQLKEVADEYAIDIVDSFNKSVNGLVTLPPLMQRYLKP